MAVEPTTIVDKNGKDLREGDRVLIEAVVVKVHEAEGLVYLTLDSQSPLPSLTIDAVALDRTTIR